MAKKITIQHWHTTSGTTAPTGLIEGEIAISHATGSEAIFLKNDKNNKEVKFIPKTQIDELISAATTGITSDLTTHETLKGGFSGSQPVFGHTTIIGGDLKNIAGVTEGHAAASFHTHGQYLTGVTADTSQTIASLIENGVAKIGLTTDITNQINSGVSGYTKIVAHETESGTTGEIGHVKLVGGDLSGKTGSITDGEAAASHHFHSQYIAKNEISNGLKIEEKGQDKKLSVKAKTDGGITVDANGVSIDSGLTKTWNDASSAITAFLKDANLTGNAVDTLIEIQQFLDGTGSTVQTLLKTLDELTDTVDNNTTAITQNSENISNLTTSASTNASDIAVLNQTVTNINDKIGSGFTSDNTITSEIKSLKDQQANFVTSIIGSKNINVSNPQGKQFIIIHTSASTQNSAITATNDTTGLSFGSEFKIVDNIGYDANGHVVSGSTQTLKLPTLENAQESIGINRLGKAGIVRIVGYKEDYDVYSLSSFPSTDNDAPLAVGIKHYHSNYVKFTDLSNNTGNTITISCGTY